MTLEQIILKDGTIFEQKKYEVDGEKITHYIVKFEGLTFTIAVNENEEIIYCRRQQEI